MFRRRVRDLGNKRDTLMFDLLFDTGLRLSELTGLNVGDVTGKQYLTIVGKGRKERTLPIGSVNGLTGKIAQFISWKQERGETIHPRAPLFCSKRTRMRINRRISNREVQYLVNCYAEKAELERHFHPHACQHSFGFKLGRNEVPIQVIKKLMGHSKIETTAIYVEPPMDQLKGALNCLA